MVDYKCSRVVFQRPPGNSLMKKGLRRRGRFVEEPLEGATLPGNSLMKKGLRRTGRAYSLTPPFIITRATP